MLGARIPGVQAAEGKVRVAWGDVIDVESLPMAVALARAKDRGIDNEITSFAQEDLAIQATVGGQADIGIATPFAVMQKVKDLRIFFQDEALIFYAVVSNEYKTWKDLDGQPFVFHARGSGTEAYGNFMAKQNGINFGQISYLSGSDNRAVAHARRPDQGHHSRPGQHQPRAGKGAGQVPSPSRPQAGGHQRGSSSPIRTG